MTWIEVGPLQELQRRRKQVVDVGDTPVLVLWHNDAVYAFQNICIHQQRELVKGVILNHRLICAGHQWAFEMGTGWCRERERSQPVYETRVEGDIVYVNSEPNPTAEESSSSTQPVAGEALTNYDHSDVPDAIALPAKALPSLLVETGLVEQAPLDRLAEEIEH